MSPAAAAAAAATAPRLGLSLALPAERDGAAGGAAEKGEARGGWPGVRWPSRELSPDGAGRMLLRILEYRFCKGQAICERQMRIAELLQDSKQCFHACNAKLF